MRVAVSKEVEFDAGHRVPDHGSKCRHPHGHRYRVRATCAGDVVNEPGAADDGMVVDFGLLKGWLTEHVHDRFDHGFICKHSDPLRLFLADWLTADGTVEPRLVVVDYAPTAENIARDVFTSLAPIVAAHWRTLRLVRIEVWETPTSLAVYEED